MLQTEPDSTQICRSDGETKLHISSDTCHMQSWGKRNEIAWSEAKKISNHETGTFDISRWRTRPSSHLTTAVDAAGCTAS